MMDSVSRVQMTFDAPSRGSLPRLLLSCPSIQWKGSSGGPLGKHISEMLQHLFHGVSGAISEGLRESHTSR